MQEYQFFESKEDILSSIDWILKIGNLSDFQTRKLLSMRKKIEELACVV